MSFAGIELTLGSLMAVPPDDLGKFRARLKQLQRLGFPDGVNIGRGARMPYSEHHLIQLAVALEVMNCGVPAKFATDVVSRLWNRFAVGIWIANNVIARSQKSAPAVLAVVRARAIHNSAGEQATVTIEDANSLANMVSHVISDEPSARIHIDLTLMLLRLQSRANDIAQIKSYFLTTAIGFWFKDIPEYDPFDPERDWLRFGAYTEDGTPYASDSEA